MPARACGRSEQLASRAGATEMGFDCLACQIGHGCPPPLRFVTEPRVEFIGEFHSRSLHVCQHTRGSPQPLTHAPDTQLQRHPRPERVWEQNLAVYGADKV